MQRLLAIAGLTWKAAFRYRLFWVLSVLLVGAVVGLPLLIKDDGTARGLTQILLTYTLSAITGLLGFSTLWLACGTLARDIEECQIQMISVKPIARWQIWLGKWIGILALNAGLLALSGTSVFVLLKMRASQLPAEQQKILQEEIFVARASLKLPIPDLKTEVEREFQDALKQSTLSAADQSELHKQIEERVKAEQQVVPSRVARRWIIDAGLVKNFMRDQPLRLRVKFHPAQPVEGATYEALWQIGPPESSQLVRLAQRLPGDSFQEFEIPANLLDAEGKLTIDFFNRNETALLFPLEDGLEVLYREGTFGLNFARGIGIIFCWLSLLAALGLAAASVLSFPVAAFFSLAILVMGLSSGTLSSVVEQGSVLGADHETGKAFHTVLDSVIVPFFSGMLKIINLVQDFSPIDSLSTGRSITWGQLGQAVAQIIFLLGGIFGGIGMILFSRRELATAQGTS